MLLFITNPIPFLHGQVKSKWTGYIRISYFEVKTRTKATTEDNKPANILLCWRRFIYMTVQATEQGLSIIAQAARTEEECRQKLETHTDFLTVLKTSLYLRLYSVLTVHYSLCTVHIYCSAEKSHRWRSWARWRSPRVQFECECSSVHCGPGKRSVVYLQLFHNRSVVH